MLHRPRRLPDRVHRHRARRLDSEDDSRLGALGILQWIHRHASPRRRAGDANRRTKGHRVGVRAVGTDERAHAERWKPNEGDLVVPRRRRRRDGDGVPVDALDAGASDPDAGKKSSGEFYDEWDVFWQRVRDGGGAGGDAIGRRGVRDDGDGVLRVRVVARVERGEREDVDLAAV